MFHCLLRHYSKAKIFASAGGAHTPPALSSLQPNGCVVVIYLPGLPPFKIAGSAPEMAIFHYRSQEYFDGTPFIMNGSQMLQCQFGQHYYKSHVGNSGHTQLQKLDVQHIIYHVHELQLYPIDISNSQFRESGNKEVERFKEKEIQ